MNIEHIALWVSDIERVKNFYQTYFHATSSDIYHNKRTKFTSYFLSFTDGARLEIMHQPDIMNNHGALHIEFCGYAHFAMSLGTSQAVDALTEQLRKDGYPVVREPRTTGDGYYESIVLDPEGNKIELTI